MDYLKILNHRIPTHVVKSQKLTPEQVEDQFDPYSDFDHPKKVDRIMSDPEIKESGTGNIMLDRVVHYSVSKGSDTLKTDFKNTVVSNIAKATKGGQMVFPYSSVDDIIEQDFQKESRKYGPATTLIYILHSDLVSTMSYKYSNNGLSNECGGSVQAGNVRIGLHNN